VTNLHASLLIILPPLVHYRNVTSQGQDFQAQGITTTSSPGGRPSTPPCSMEASAIIQEQDVILQSCRHLKGNYYLSPHIDTVRGPSKDHDRLSLTKSEQDLSRDEEDEIALTNETDASDSVRDSMQAISDCQNLEVVWTTKLPINPKQYDTLVATIDVSKGKTEHNNAADSLLLIDALQTEFTILPLRTDPWVVVSDVDS
jgi:hypothetical protein